MFGKKSIFSILVGLVLLIFSISSVFAQAELVGKYREISGPSNLKYLGIARTNQAYRLMEMALERKEIEMVFENFDIAVVKNHIGVCVLDVKLFKHKAKVLVLEGLQEGAAGWVPLSWIKGDYQKVRF
ncbi:MAG: hypothetical protein K9L61_04680 [Candidatus Omnitrophica bacterium]|nr:hypothetical protein [Candidatus Omnitrophota bacterium]